MFSFPPGDKIVWVNFFQNRKKGTREKTFRKFYHRNYFCRLEEKPIYVLSGPILAYFPIVSRPFLCRVAPEVGNTHAHMTALKFAKVSFANCDDMRNGPYMPKFGVGGERKRFIHALFMSGEGWIVRKRGKKDSAVSDFPWQEKGRRRLDMPSGKIYTNIDRSLGKKSILGRESKS